MGINYGFDIAAGALFSFFFALVILLFVLFTAADWRLFSKAGEDGWQSLIPIWRIIVLYKIVYGNPWKSLLMLIPLLNIVFYAGLMMRLAMVFGKSRSFGILMIFFSAILTLVLAFSDCKYLGPDEESFI